MVVSAQHLASDVGRDVLLQGGNAVDAAVATAFALAVTHPSAGNIGGGGFLVYRGSDGEVTTFNFREKAPLAATGTMFLDESGQIRNRSNHDSLLAVGVPGSVAGLALAHKRLGSLAWSRLVQPAVDLARDGFTISWGLASSLRWLRAAADRYPSTAEVFLRPDGSSLEAGDILQQRDLAATLERIRDDGAAGFYFGRTARLLADYMRGNGGIVTEEDLANYSAVETAPVKGTYRGFDVYAMGPPSSGGIVLVEMLNILEGFDLGTAGHNTAGYLHLLTESMRRAYADRAEFLGDPDFNPEMPVEELVSKDHARILRRSIDLLTASQSDSSRFNGLLLETGSETTHISVVDRDRNAVSLTTTLEQGFGVKHVVEGAGFLLNNEMGDFNAMAGHTTRSGSIGTAPNLIEPAKRMLSNMTPTIVARAGEVYLVVGSPGGRTIQNTVLQVLLNVIDHGMNVAEAVEAPRIHHAWLPDEVRVERFGVSPDTIRLLELMGHRTRIATWQGRAMGIQVDSLSGLVLGAPDSRAHDGRAAGF
jgi:gamma-glutamyltranspeptidase/glutathione hydrolase